MAERYLLHIIPDDKFSNMVHRDFENYGENNKYALLGRSKKLEYIKGWKPEFIKKNQLHNYIKKNGISTIIFHSLLDKYILLHLPRHIKVVWCGWGYDYYTYLLSDLYPSGMILPATKKIHNDSLIKRKITNTSLIELFSFVYRFIRRKFLGLIYNKQNLLSRIDFFIPVLEDEFALVKNKYPWLKWQYIPWSYGTLEDDYILSTPFDDEQTGILVGNSATPENNHIEAFHFIYENLNWQMRDIYCPLSYGDREYALKIKKYGEHLFGDRFKPLMTFLDKEIYNKIIASCEYVVMNHIRQQALGNIISAIALGKKIFLNESNPISTYLRKNHIKIFYIETQNSSNKNYSFTSSEMKYNKTRINDMWSREQIEFKTKEFVNRVNN